MAHWHLISDTKRGGLLPPNIVSDLMFAEAAFEDVGSICLQEPSVLEADKALS